MKKTIAMVMAILMCATMGLGVFARATTCPECGSAMSRVSESTGWVKVDEVECDSTNEMDDVFSKSTATGYRCPSCKYEDIQYKTQRKTVCNHC